MRPWRTPGGTANPGFAAERLAGEIRQRFAECVSGKFGLTSVGMSIGYSFYSSDGTDGQALINAADNAMDLMKHGRARE